MPELPELVVYRDHLEHHLKDRTVAKATLHDPFVLRTTSPEVGSIEGRRALAVHRAAKELALEFEGGTALGFHLMRAGRLHLKDASRFRPNAKRTRFSLTFEGGPVLEMTEAGKEHRARLACWDNVARFREDAEGGDPLDPMDANFGTAALGARLRAESRQLKSALRDRAVVVGIGNAYADEILFAARLSPVRLTRSLGDEEIARLAQATSAILQQWIDRVRLACADGATLPTQQNEWRSDMLVHGKAGHACPNCGGVIARISFKDSETNYCPKCQNDGKLLADRRMSKFGLRREEKRKG